MAILRNGMFGPVSGKIGNTVVYEVNNRTVVRIVGENHTPPTLKQLVNRNDMRVVNAFLKQVSPFIKVGFAEAAKAANMYPQNAAVSYNKKYALKGIYPDTEIDYQKVRLTEGRLPVLDGAVVQLAPGGLKFSWDPQNWMGWTRCNDQAMLMVYMPEVDPESGIINAFYQLSGAKRLMGNDFLEIPAALMQQRMEVYISVIADDRKSVGCSVYLGRIN